MTTMSMCTTTTSTTTSTTTTTTTTSHATPVTIDTEIERVRQELQRVKTEREDANRTHKTLVDTTNYRHHMIRELTKRAKRAPFHKYHRPLQDYTASPYVTRKLAMLLKTTYSIERENRDSLLLVEYLEREEQIFAFKRVAYMEETKSVIDQLANEIQASKRASELLESLFRSELDTQRAEMTQLKKLAEEAEAAEADAAEADTRAQGVGRFEGLEALLYDDEKDDKGDDDTASETLSDTGSYSDGSLMSVLDSVHMSQFRQAGDTDATNTRIKQRVPEISANNNTSASPMTPTKKTTRGRPSIVKRAPMLLRLWADKEKSNRA